jgi:DNA replication protein DnaC
MSSNDDLVPLLKRLKLSGLLLSLQARLKQAIDDNLSHSEFLFLLFNDETERRERNQLELRIKRASFDSGKSLEDFDFIFNPQIPKSKILKLGTCQFIHKNEVVILIGATGVGKSHLAEALGLRACMSGFKVMCRSANELFAELRSACANDSYDRAFAKLLKPDLLIIDDLGIRALRQDEPVDLYELIRARYEKGALIITSNRALKEWGELFEDDLMASAALDRLLHHGHILELKGDSFRTGKRKRKKK